MNYWEARKVAREVWHLLVIDHPDGLKVERLCQLTKTTDREMSDALSLLRVLAAENPDNRDGHSGTVYIIGFDPESRLITKAHDAAQANRIIEHYYKHVSTRLEGIVAQVKAYTETYGRPAPRGLQDGLFTVQDAKETMRWVE